MKKIIIIPDVHGRTFWREPVKKYKNVEINLVVENDLDNEKMVISTPFKKKHQFYLNYKENYSKENGGWQVNLF